jgi:hypothetical protein
VQQHKDKQGKPVRFIRKNGRVIPVRADRQGGGGVYQNMQKRKGARYDKESGYYLDKKQRQAAKGAKAADAAYYKGAQERSKKFGDRGMEIGAAAGIGIGAIKFRTTGGMLKSTLIGAAAGFVGGRVLGAATYKKDKKDVERAEKAQARAMKKTGT